MINGEMRNSMKTELDRGTEGLEEEGEVHSNDDHDDNNDMIMTMLCVVK
jgi:hypothetical protein